MKVYLLSIEELHIKEEESQEEAGNSAGTQALYEKCLQKIDAHRLEKVHKLKAGNARNLSIGAGLLLQLAWADCADAETTRAQIGKMQAVEAQDYRWRELREQTGKSEVEMVILDLSDILQRLASDRFPLEIPYQYGDKGKPDFAEGDYHFSLSHSGDYVCLAVDKKQIGIDIQKMRPLMDLKVAERFFTIREQEALKAYDEKQAQEQLFFTIWVKKEAYAKLTGEGIGTGVKMETLTQDFLTAEILADTPHMCGGIRWDMLQAPEGYRMAVCQFQNE